MARRHSPLQQFREACQIARDHGMHVVECKSRSPKGPRTEYVVYRSLPDGRDTRLGKRSTVAGLRAYVTHCAETL